ncbi:MAG: alpha-amylase family glycosyl hydrolase [Planctomycetota bacterium]|nr:alpha-amylase family glycosyl hydrolase [Planctomycetota bacterium]
MLTKRVLGRGMGAAAAVVVAGVVGGAGGTSWARDPFNSPVSDEIFYHFMPIAWRDSNNDASRFGDFQGMTDSLDYLQSLGVTAVWMNPIFPSAAYHGYQHGAGDQIDPDFGTQQQFLAFVAAAKARGIKVYLDFVVYGISQNSVWFQSAFGNPASQYDSWLAFENQSNTQFLGSSYNSWNGATVGFIHWDLRNAAVRSMVTSWALKWLDPDNNPATDDGIAGYRFDHCWVTYPNGPSGWGYNLSSFWTPFFAALRAAKPDVFNFGEQADWGSFGGEFLSQFDAMFTKPFEFAARDALAFEYAQPLYDRMDTTISSAVAAGRGTFLTVIGDHDVDRLASAIGSFNTLTPDRAHAAAAVLMLQPFAPVMYYGDELGMLGFRQEYGSDDSDIPRREPFKWNRVAGAPMSNYYVVNPESYNGRFSRDNDGRSVEEQQGVTQSVLETYRRLIALRKAQPALRRGDYRPARSTNGSVWSFVRRHEPQGGAAETLLVAVNLSGFLSSASVDLRGFTLPGGTSAVTDVVSGSAAATLTEANRAGYPVTMGAYGFRVLRLADVAPVPPPVSLVSGRAIPANYGAAGLLATQNTPTTFGNNSNELNQLYARRDRNGLRIGLTGNLNTDGTGLVVLVDGRPGGQSVLNLADQNPPPAGLPALTGTRFDEGFEPETMLFINAFGSSIYVDQLELSGGGSFKTYRGRGTVNTGSGILQGGENFEGVQVALDNTNTAGVTSSSAANAATATTGAEIYLPNEALGLPSPACAEVRIAAFICGTNGIVSSQWLPGSGGAAQNLGFAPDLRTVPGTQHAAGPTAAECVPSTCPDLSGDGTVNFTDVTGVLQAWGAQYPASTGPGDVDADGSVSFTDITQVLRFWGAMCGG